jgi:acyl-CoA reductase-like NAD-dependent aldehyde dehydrogenase
VTVLVAPLLRDSGFRREHGDAAIENFTEPKVVWINTAA